MKLKYHISKEENTQYHTLLVDGKVASKAKRRQSLTDYLIRSKLAKNSSKASPSSNMLEVALRQLCLLHPAISSKC